MKELADFGHLCYQKEMTLYQLQFDMQRESGVKWEQYGSKPLDQEIRWLRDMQDQHTRLERGLSVSDRLEQVQIECADALYIIQSRDHQDAFFYCDPPYVGSNCGNYKGYTEADYEALLRTLSAIKGKFLLSSYPTPQLDCFIKFNGWSTLQKEMYVTVNAKSGNLKKKVEVLTANYPILKSF